MKTIEKKLPRSNNRKTYKSKISKFGYPLALSTVLLLSSCGGKDSPATKALKAHDDAIERVEAAKEKIQNEEKDLIEAQEELQEAKQELINAEAKEQQTKEKAKEESNKL